jgi:hypothetical protein
MPTDLATRTRAACIAVAERKGLNVVGMAYCWAPDGPPWTVLDESKPTDDYSPVYLVPEGERTGETMFGFACGHPAMDLRRVEDYPTDPRAYMPLLEEMRNDLSRVSPYPGGRWLIEITDECQVKRFIAPTPGLAICEAWVAWDESEEVADG